MLTHMCSKKIRSDYGYEILRTKELRLYNAKPKYSHLEICLNLLVIQSNRVVFVYLSRIRTSNIVLSISEMT